MKIKFYLISLLCAVVACDSANDPNLTEAYNDTALSFAPLESDNEFNSTVESLIAKQEEVQNDDQLIGDGVPEEGANSTEFSDSITNNQESDVDEGGIVKAFGNYLVILRQGRLFIVNAEDELLNISSNEAYFPGSSLGTWYDEMLISDNTLVVLGYSYEQNATEVGIFTIDNAGQLAHRSTAFIDSGDYFSFQNYASRLVDDKLIMYMPKRIYKPDESEPYTDQIPKVRYQLASDQLSEPESFLDIGRIFSPFNDSYWPILHTVAECDVTAARLSCEASAVIGRYSNAYYISNEDFYLSIGDSTRWWYGFNSGQEALEQTQGSTIIRFDYAANTVTAAKIDGQIDNQFSLSLKDDQLMTFSTEYDYQERKVTPYFSKINLADFSADADAIYHADSFRLISAESFFTIARFSGDFLYYGGSYFDRSDALINSLNVNTPENKSPIPLTHSISRIESLDEYIAVFGWQNTEEDNYQLEVSIINGDLEQVSDKTTLGNAYIQEWRSHGFNSTRTASGEIIFGIALSERLDVLGDFWWQRHRPYIDYYKFSSNGEITSIGKNQASIRGPAIDCVISCIDWYGSNRAVFFNNKIISLMNYELVSNQLIDNTLSSHSSIFIDQ